MSKVHGLNFLLRAKSATYLIVLFAIFAADENRYDNITTKFCRGDATIINSDHFALKKMGEAIDARNIVESSFSGKRLPTANKDVAAAPISTSGKGGGRSGGGSGGGGGADNSGGSGNYRPFYPPEKPPWVSQIHNLCKAGEKCPGCFHDSHLKSKTACINLACGGFILTHNPTAAEAITKKWDEDHPIKTSGER